MDAAVMGLSMRWGGGGKISSHSGMIWGLGGEFSSLLALGRAAALPRPIARPASDFVTCYSGGRRRSRLKCTILCCQLQHSTNSVYLQKADKYSSVDQATSYLHVQSLRNFPIEKLCGEVVVVRLDSAHLLGPLEPCNLSLKNTLLTIKYLHEARAKVVIVTSWDTVLQSDNPVLKSTEALAEYLTSLLQVGVISVNGLPGLTAVKQEGWVQNDIILFENLRNFKGEVSNCNDFSQKLASGAAIFVNDSFSLSHKIIASTVGITRFCYASLAGFHFEKELMQLLKIADTTRRPYIAIIGGSNFSRNVPALHLLASLCDGLFFVGKLSFQIMSGLGILVPSHFIERNTIAEVLQFIQVARARNIPIYYPTDMWCLNNDDNEKLAIFNSTDLSSGWTPVDIGPSTLEKISSLVPLYKKILWIGPTNYDLTQEVSVGVTHLGQILEKAHSDICDIILVGSAACMAVKGASGSSFRYTKFQNASVVWEFLKGRILPGIAALDKCYPYQIPWSTVFSDPILPLVVDIGSGNGLFLFQMARNHQSYNFLGLEMNEKEYTFVMKASQSNQEISRIAFLGNEYPDGPFCTVCTSSNKVFPTLKPRFDADFVYCSCIPLARYFVSTNATSTFRSIVSSYPGQLTLVTIQCPNPDFNKEKNRWRMVRRMLVEAVADLLQPNGKVYLQSDVESVLLGMKEQFISYSKGRLVVDGDDSGHQMENPFGVASDWERHVLARGAPMYRTMLRKVVIPSSISVV